MDVSSGGRRTAVTLATVIAAAILAWAPAAVGLAVAVAAAVAWCRWLERHPAA